MSTPEWSGRHSGKDELRAEVWQALVANSASPKDPFGHIPDFHGSDKAAAQLATLPIWQRARVIKANPDTAQAPVRLRAMQEGKLLYMAVPRLVDARCFVELRADDLAARGVSLADAAHWQGALDHGRLVAFEEMQPIDLVITGCVAVSRSGGRTGKGAGFADLELGMLRELGLVRPGTPIITTVHALQVVDGDRLPMMPHDSALDWVITPDEVIETKTTHPQPAGIDWDAVQPDQYASIPALSDMRKRRSPR
ncbi:MAG TPA: 5-formyltetrahydrofolate cyclo-ligase [Roseiflexaceae bacterium]|nr:5-formyltetrahydrofolate cyclo-ligase [Roseiflexaceae bacterium]